MAASNKIQVGYIEAQDGAQFEVDAGTAAAPGLVFDDSAATGLYSPGTGQLAFSTSGKQTALRILADGKVGIDCSPTVALEVNGTIKASAIDAPIEGTLDDWIIHAGDTNTKFGFPAADTFSVETSGNSRLYIKSDGKIGINTTTPNSALEVQGDGGVNDATITFTRLGSPSNGSVIGSNFYRIGTDSVAGMGAYRESAMDDAYLAFHTQPTGGNFTERLRMDSRGRVIVGGGTHAGGAQLVVKGDSNTINTYASVAFCRMGANPTSNTGLANLRFSGGSAGTSRAAEINVKCDGNWSEGSSHPSKMELGVADSGGTTANTPSLTLKAGGNVEINRGQLIMTSSATKTFFDFSTTNNTTRGLFSVSGKDGSGNAVTVKIGGFGDTSRGEIFTHSNHGLGFATNNAATQMILDTSGNLSISPNVYGGGGTSPQLYVRGTSGRQVKIHNPNAGTCSLQMTNSTTGQGEDAGTQLFTQGNSGDFWIQSAFATADLVFATKASGASTTEKLRLRSGGVVQIGGATENNADIDWSNTKLTIKQSANQIEDGIYIERSGERRGFYIYVGGALGQNDALGIVSQQLGGDTAVLSIDRGGDVVVGPGNIVMSQGKGISFINAADVASGETVAGSVLDDYEEGTYTPTISNLGNHTTTTGNTYGAYTKIGDLVTVRFRYQWTNRSTTNGAYNVILSLPFTGANVKTPGHGSCAVEGCQPNSSDRTSYHSSVPQNAAYVQFRCSGANVSENSFHGGIGTSLSTGYFIGVVSYKTT